MLIRSDGNKKELCCSCRCFLLKASFCNVHPTSSGKHYSKESFFLALVMVEGGAVHSFETQLMWSNLCIFY